MLSIIILATLFISLLSFVGILIFFKKRYSQKMMEASVSLAAAVLLGNVFMHLLPELAHGHEHEMETMDFHQISLWILGTIVFFFLTEKYLHWHNCHHHQDHEDAECIKPMGINVLVGDGIHNFIDGAAIAVAFMLDINIGIMATIAIALHEIPQEIGDFSLLLHSGFSKAKALWWNFMSAALAVIGGIFTYFVGQNPEHQTILTAMATGSFLYIALSDIMPHLHQDKNKYYFIQTIWFVAGLLIVYFLNAIIHLDVH